MFWVKKIISNFLMPFPFCLGMAFIGLYLLWFTSKQRLGKFLITASLLLLTVMSYHPVSSLMIRPLETWYPYVVNLESVRYIAVLGGGCSLDPSIPTLSKISDASLFRLAEAIRLHIHHPQAKIIFSGKDTSKANAEAAQALGVPKNRIIIDNTAMDTKDEADHIYRIVGKEKFVLITSASHIPRAMGLFKKLGMNPIPVCAEYQAKKAHKISPNMFFPNPNSIAKAEIAVHEYLGLVWAKLRNQMD